MFVISTDFVVRGLGISISSDGYKVIPIFGVLAISSLGVIVGVGFNPISISFSLFSELSKILELIEFSLSLRSGTIPL